jgi:hypothetical protein
MSKANIGDRSALIPWLYLSLGLVQAAHSVEEVFTGLWKNFPLVTGIVHSRFPSFPVLHWSAQGFAAANLIIVALMLAFSPFPFMNKTWSHKIVFIIAIIESLNGLNHITAAVLTKGYFSGCISAVLLLTIGISIPYVSRGKHEHQPV